MGVGHRIWRSLCFVPHPREEQSSFPRQPPSLHPATPQPRVQIPGPASKTPESTHQAFQKAHVWPPAEAEVNHPPFPMAGQGWGNAQQPPSFSENLWPQLFLAPSQRVLDRAGFYIPLCRWPNTSLSKVTVWSTHYSGTSIRTGIERDPRQLPIALMSKRGMIIMGPTSRVIVKIKENNPSKGFNYLLLFLWL